ncbi:MAG: hypothetical protein JWO56_2411 [Acidobacteria bacterium]|nr:hypothetical protein [Acidobacteriota bacterium]
MSWAWMRALFSMASTASRASASDMPSLSIRAQPRTAVIGVRNSCESVARNWSLRRFASSSALWTSCSSVMSRNSRTAPAWRPSRCSGASEQETGNVEPSFRTKTSRWFFSGSIRSRAFRIGQAAAEWPPPAAGAWSRSWNGAFANSSSS